MYLSWARTLDVRKGGGLRENYNRFYQGELTMRLPAPTPVRPIHALSRSVKLFWSGELLQ
jgi:hypothetical protein